MRGAPGGGVRGGGRGGDGGQGREAGLGRAGGVGQAVPQAPVLVLPGGAGLAHARLGLLQQRAGLGPGVLAALQAGVLVVLPLLRRGATLVLMKGGRETLAQRTLYVLFNFY